MSQESGFFNAQLVGNTYDRVYNAEQFAAYFASFIGNGIFGGSMEQLAVKANTPNNMTINVSPGTAWINGWWYRNDEDYNLSIAIADGVLSRIDTVVLRWGNSERNIWLQVIQGELSQNPVAPSIQRNADYYDLKLCEVNVPAGTPYIRQSLITDTRLDNNVCGLVTGVVDQIDTTELYNQFRSQFSEFMSDNETEYDSWYRTIQAQFTSWMNGEKTDFDSWFDNMKDQLSEDAAGHLQLEIDDINNWITNKKATYLAEVETHDGSVLAKRIYGMSVQDGTPTPDSPVEIQSAKADFRCTGKNLIPYPYYGTNATLYGITYTINEDGSITAQGTATSNAYLRLADNFKIKQGTYKGTLNATGESNTTYTLRYYNDAEGWSHTFNNNSNVTIPSDRVGRFALRISTGQTVDLIFKPQLVLATNSDLSYKLNQHTDITTDLTLRSIEVASTDDYTYERDGKYYIADTIDWSEDRGYEITRRVGSLDKSKLSHVFHSTVNDRTGTVCYRWNVAYDKQPKIRRRYAILGRCSHFKVGVTNADPDADSLYPEFRQLGYMAISSTNPYIYCMLPDTITSVTDAQAWLDSADLVIDYTCEPYTEPITSEQAQALLSLKTYDEATSITATSDIEPTIDLEYAASEMSAKALTGHNEGYIAQELEGVYGVKNLIPYPYYIGTGTYNGINFTVHDDGSMDISGTASTGTGITLIGTNNKLKLKPGLYKVCSNQPYDITTFNVSMKVTHRDGSYENIRITDSDKEFVFLETDYIDYMTIWVSNGGTIRTVTNYQIMIRAASIQSNEYQPYAMSNYELTLKVKDLYNSFLQALTDLKSTAIAQAVGATGDTFESVIATLATIINRGAVSKTLGLGESYTVPQGYHNGSGKVSVSVTSQEKTITASRSQQVVTPDSGKVLSKVTVNKYPDASGSYPVTSNGTKDMGATNNYRYVEVKVPASSSMKLVGTYSSAASVNVSSYGATSASQFIAFPSTNGSLEMSGGTGRTGSFGSGWINGNASYTAPSLSLSGNTLSVTPATLYAYANSPAGNCSNTVNLSTSVYFIG